MSLAETLFLCIPKNCGILDTNYAGERKSSSSPVQICKQLYDVYEDETSLCHVSDPGAQTSKAPGRLLRRFCFFMLCFQHMSKTAGENNKSAETTERTREKDRFGLSREYSRATQLSFLNAERIVPLPLELHTIQAACECFCAKMCCM